MKIFLSAIETTRTVKRGNNPTIPISKYFVKNGVRMKWNLMSFYGLQRSDASLAEFIRDNSEEIMIDSGAHSFQKGIHVDWDKYTDSYMAFIRRIDRRNVIGFFEMDVDNIIGYDRVLELRRRLEDVSDKIIPVWHKNRGINDFKKMCQQYQGKIVAITGFRNEDIKDDQYIMFLKYAKKYNCKVHCLGMTRREILDKVPFDFTDSSSWLANTVYGKDLAQNRKVSRTFSKENRDKLFLRNYQESMKLQEYYYSKWRKVCED